MSDETELDAFRQQVNCAAVLEQFSSGWKLDTRESTRGALKYRRGAGEIIIVNHDGAIVPSGIVSSSSMRGWRRSLRSILKRA